MNMPLTPRAKILLEKAEELSKQKGDSYVSAETIFLACFLLEDSRTISEICACFDKERVADYILRPETFFVSKS